MDQSKEPQDLAGDRMKGHLKPVLIAVYVRDSL